MVRHQLPKLRTRVRFPSAPPLRSGASGPATEGGRSTYAAQSDALHEAAWCVSPPMNYPEFPESCAPISSSAVVARCVSFIKPCAQHIDQRITPYYNQDVSDTRADWTYRGEYIRNRHDVTPSQANEALADPSRLVHRPDYNSKTGRTNRIIGYSHTAGAILAVIVLEKDNKLLGVNAWFANAKDRRNYRERNTHEQE